MVNWWTMDYEVWRLGGWKGAPGMRAFFRSNFFHFHAVFGKKMAKNGPMGNSGSVIVKSIFFSKEVPLDIVINVNIEPMSQNQVFLTLCPSKVMFLKPTEFTTLYRRHVDE